MIRSSPSPESRRGRIQATVTAERATWMMHRSGERRTVSCRSGVPPNSLATPSARQSLSRANSRAATLSARGVLRNGCPYCSSFMRPRWRRSRSLRSRAKPLDVLRRRSFLPLDDVEFHELALVEGLVTTALDGGVVHEAIFLTIGTADETEALRLVEPLHGTRRSHILNSSCDRRPD